MWHIAKAALTRDRALRLLGGEAHDATAEYERDLDRLTGRSGRGEAGG